MARNVNGAEAALRAAASMLKIAVVAENVELGAYLPFVVLVLCVQV